MRMKYVSEQVLIPANNSHNVGKRGKHGVSIKAEKQQARHICRERRGFCFSREKHAFLDLILVFNGHGFK